MRKTTQNALYTSAIVIVAALIAAAAWGWIYPDARHLDGAYQREAKERAEHYAERAHIAAANRCASVPAPARAECVTEERESARPSQRDEYDLGAQRSTAVWTRAMGLAALVAMTVGIIGVGLIFVTFRETRRTADAAIDSAKGAALSANAAQRASSAANEANAIARENMQRQLRAYLTVEPGGINKAADGQVRAPLLIQNVGETPAHKVMSFSRFAISEHPRDFNPAALEAPDNWLKGETNDATLGRGVVRYLYPYVREEFLGGHMEAIANKREAIVHFGNVVYEDVFGETHRTHFAFYHWGEELSPETSLRCRLGNSAD